MRHKRHRLVPPRYILSEREYLRFLNHILDEVFELVDLAFDWSNAELARQSGLGVSTVHNLDTRKTKYPRYFTVLKLCKAVGWEMKLIRGPKPKFKIKKRAG
jgi:DNA-binding Xre family transcriptional regulator